jgi:phosphoglycolate phosphatase
MASIAGIASGKRRIVGIRRQFGMASPPTLIVFDCDGTLADSQHLIVQAMSQTFAEAGLPSPQRASILRTVGLSIPDALLILAPDQFPDARNELARIYRERCMILRRAPDTAEPMFEGAASLLFSLAARDDVLLGIATGKSKRGVERFIEQNGLHGMFATLQTADSAPSKPHPAMLLQAMDETGASPETTVMIGDTSYDMIMAACADVPGIGVSWGYHTAADLKRSGAKAVVSTFSALDALLSGPEMMGRYEAVA